MLAVLMFHDVVRGGGKYANDPDLLRAHFAYLRDHCPVVLPGEPLDSGRLNVCLTFDDGHASFYHTVHPMLQDLGLKAVVSISTDFIVERTERGCEQRLATSSQQGQKSANPRKKACFCTWTELREMLAGGLVQVAGHGAGHADLTRPDVDLDREILGCGQIIADRLGRFPSSFVFPLGRVNSRVKQHAARHYPHLMRIGQALNRGWRNPGGILYRLQGDGLRDETGPLRSLWRPRVKYYWNTLRLR